jgi:hypothetical protein
VDSKTKLASENFCDNIMALNNPVGPPPQIMKSVAEAGPTCCDGGVENRVDDDNEHPEPLELVVIAATEDGDIDTVKATTGVIELMKKVQKRTGIKIETKASGIVTVLCFDEKMKWPGPASVASHISLGLGTVHEYIGMRYSMSKEGVQKIDDDTAHCRHRNDNENSKIRLVQLRRNR